MDPNKDGITTDEFEASFRDARRARATAIAEKKGRETLTKLLSRIKVVHPDFESPTDWFILVNTSPGPPGSPVEVTGLELREGLKKLGGFTSANIDSLLKFMDPDGDCDLTIPEFEAAQEKLTKPPESESKAAEAGAVIVRLEVHMDEANIRMIDLFRMMDKDNEGSIEPDEMRAGLKKLALPSGVERAKKKIAKEKLTKKINEEMEAKKKQLTMDKRLKEAEESGAAKVLQELEAAMVKKGQRMIDLFREMDKSGDGLISRQELFQGLKSMAGPTAHQKAIMQKAVEDQETRMAELQEKQIKEAAAKEKVLRAVESGAASVLGRLHEFITEGEQEKKIADIFREYDSSGEGSLSHGELAMAMDLLDMELTEDEVSAFVGFIDESGDGDVDLMELDAAMKAFLRIKRLRPNFGKKSKERMTEGEISELVQHVEDALGSEVDGAKLEALFTEQNALNTDVFSNPKFQTDAQMMKRNKRYKNWLSASRLSRAPTGRLPTLEEQLSEEQLLELETAKLRLKKERKIAGEAHFKHWLDKKKKEDKKKIEKFIEAEKEELSGDLPPVNLLNGEQVQQIVDFTVALEETPESGDVGTITCEKAKAAFIVFRPISMGIMNITDPAIGGFLKVLQRKKEGFGKAKGAILTIWRHKKNVLDEINELLSSAVTPDNYRTLLEDKICKSTKFKSKESFARAKKEFEESEKARKKKEAEGAWKEWSERKDKQFKASKRARKKEYKELIEKQRREFDEMKATKKKRREAENAKYMAGVTKKPTRDGMASTTGSIGGKSKQSKRSSYTNASTMSKSVALSLCEAAISPYGVDPGKTYGMKNIALREQLKRLKKSKGKIPKSLRAEAEAFRKAVAGPVPKHFEPIKGAGSLVGNIIGSDVASIAASSISGDSLSLMADQKQFERETRGTARGGRGRGERVGRSCAANSNERPSKAASLGRPPKPKTVTGSKRSGMKTTDFSGGGRVGRVEGRAEDDEYEYDNDFEDFPPQPGTVGDTLVSFDIVEMSKGVEEEVGESLDFFNSETVADLPMDVYGDDFEDDDEGSSNPYKAPLIEAVPPPAGHFSRPSTSGEGSQQRPVSRSSSTESRRRLKG